MDAKQVYTVEVLELLDGTKVTVRPFSIKKNRIAKAMLEKVMEPGILKDEDGNPILDEDGEEQPDGMTEDEAEDTFLSVSAMAVEGQLKADAELDELLDKGTMYEIIKVSTGYDFLEMEKMMKEIMRKQAEAMSLS